MPREGSNLPPIETAAQCVNGQRLKVRGMEEIDIRPGEYETKHTFLITTDIGTECLLGMDFLVPHGCVINCQDSSLSLPGNCSPIKMGPRKTPPLLCRVTIVDTVTVPHNHEMVVMGRIERRRGQEATVAEAGIVEPTSKFAQRYGLAVARVLTKPDRNNMVHVRVLNGGQDSVVVYKGTNVGLFSPIENVCENSSENVCQVNEKSSNREKVNKNLKRRPTYFRCSTWMMPISKARHKEEI